jgi:hypothetical protein
MGEWQANWQETASARTPWAVAMARISREVKVPPREVTKRSIARRRISISGERSFQAWRRRVARSSSVKKRS